MTTPTIPGLEGYVPATGSSNPTFYNAVRDAPVDPTVPEILEQTRDLVSDNLDLNREFIATAVSQANTALAALAAAKLPPGLPDPPPAPTLTTTINSALGANSGYVPDLGGLSPENVDGFNPITVTIPDISGSLPVYTSLGLVLHFPDSPTLDPVTEPVAPGIDTNLTIPDAPTKDYGGSPDLTEIVLPTLPTLTVPSFTASVPVFNTLPPQPVLQWAEPAYASDVKTAVQAVLMEMLAGGTGLPADVEQALWERGRTREDMGVIAVVDAVMEEWASRGFDLGPTGLIDKQVAVAREKATLASNDLSRDVMVKQADLEQKNRQFAVQYGIDFERVYTAIFLAVVERNFEIAKYAVETQIQIYNMQVTAYNVERQVFEAYISKYKVDLDAALFGLQVFRAQVELEKAKGELNVAKVQAFKAKVDAYSAQVEAYKAIVQAVNVRIEVQKSKVDVYKSQVDAMTAKVNAQRAKFETYDARIRAETSKVTAEEANVRVYVARTQAWSEQSQTLLKQADADMQLNRQTLEWNVANMRRVTERTQNELSVIQSRLAGFQASSTAATAAFNAQAEGARVEVQALGVMGQMQLTRFGTLTEQWKVRSQEIIQYGLTAIESQKAVAQIIGTWVSGALAGTHVSLGMSASASAGQTSGRTASSQTSQSRNVNENSQYSIVHNYQHRT